MGDHPWRRLCALPQWTLLWAKLPDLIVGVTDYDRRTITLHIGLGQAARRCTIAHELEHVARGPVLDDPVLVAKEEETIEQLVARRLIGVHELGDALAWSLDVTEVADELWVDVSTLLTRMRHLEPHESRYIARRTEHHLP